MQDLIGIPPQVLFGQLLLGLINGAFYALLSLGLSIIFGLLNIINFTHGAQYMLGAFGAWMLANALGIGFWGALIVVPVVIGALGIVLERTLLRRLYDIDHLYGFLLTFGLNLMIVGGMQQIYGSSGLRYDMPAALSGGVNLGFMYLPWSRAFVLGMSAAACLATWLLIERTKLGGRLRAAKENPALLEAFGTNVPLLLTVTYGIGVGLAALAGVLAAPLYAVTPFMGENLLIVVFAVVVIGGMGSIFGSVIAGFGLGLVESLGKVIYPEASSTLIFVIMAAVLLLRPAGLFGRAA